MKALRRLPAGRLAAEGRLFLGLWEAHNVFWWHLILACAGLREWDGEAEAEALLEPAREFNRWRAGR